MDGWYVEAGSLLDRAVEVTSGSTDPSDAKTFGWKSIHGLVGFYVWNNPCGSKSVWESQHMCGAVQDLGEVMRWLWDQLGRGGRFGFWGMLQSWGRVKFFPIWNSMSTAQIWVRTQGTVFSMLTVWGLNAKSAHSPEWTQSVCLALSLDCLLYVSIFDPLFFSPRLLFLLGFLSVPRASFYPLPCLSPFSSRTLGAFPLYPSFRVLLFTVSHSQASLLSSLVLFHTQSPPHKVAFLSLISLYRHLFLLLFSCAFEIPFSSFSLFLPVLLCSLSHTHDTHAHIRIGSFSHSFIIPKLKW